MKVGIFTMHKVLNYGSALQAYALQHVVEKLGCYCEIIDYQYPPVVKEKKIKRLIFSVFSFFKECLIGFPLKRKQKKFLEFYDNFFNLSPNSYNRNTIRTEYPAYDIYLSGSDQVWNPRFIKDDFNFLLAFVPDGRKKIAYSSSFATSEIPDELKEKYLFYLKRFDKIAVREANSVNLVKQIVGMDADAVCDPVLLMKKEEWDCLATKSNMKEDEPYILAYVLGYMFNPWPQIDDIIKKIQSKLGYRVIYLVGRKEDFLKRNSKLIKDAGPLDFLYLFQNAKFVITTSFHGAAFSALFEVPFYGVVKDKKDNGDRIVNLLESLRLPEAIVNFDENIEFSESAILRLKVTKESLNNFRNHSLNILNDEIRC